MTELIVSALLLIGFVVALRIAYTSSHHLGRYEAARTGHSQYLSINKEKS